MNKPFDSKSWADLKSHQPFYAQINFKETHRTYKSPKKVDPAKVTLPPYYPDHPVTRADWAEYLEERSVMLQRWADLLDQVAVTAGLAPVSELSGEMAGQPSALQAA